MKKIKVLYWVFTGLFAFLMLGSAIPNIISDPVSIEGFRKMNMPSYIIPFVGVAKALGVIAILIPGYPRLKEWAYAGLVFDLLGAAWCIFASGQPVTSWAFMPIPLGLAALSYIFYHKKLRLTNNNERNTRLHLNTSLS
ncbi:MAG: DoxX family protein [Chitinophagaceae bacterium]|nr:MAG: DoxX family protein [Chitinophagaceae bacterium]